MRKNYDYSVCFDKKTEELFKKSTYLGQGNNGIVFELPENKIIKIFQKEKICKAEANTLIKCKKSKYFPKIYSSGSLYIIREKVNGIRLDKYIKRNGLSKELTKEIYKLLKEFKKLKFTKLDTRCRDVYVTKDFKLMMIDPKGCYSRKVDFPRHLMKKLNKLGVLNTFLDNINEIDSKSAKYWKIQLDKYFKKENIEYL
ncbi:protein kinase [Clostridium sp.]|uniref:protein kinase n=1 Tax=Clostridium sp. TaxID=1506 RepID=UPI0026DBDA38|nr:protein kinase [Clostridium sp.]MDO5039770.1 protein kinase [Clostridium sp.]